MRKVLRKIPTRDYWRSRWSPDKADPPRFKSMDIYPIKFAEEAILGRKRILEAGCGLGRVLRHYHGEGKFIVGIDYIESALVRIGEADPSIRTAVSDILRIPFRDASFDLVLAFGVFHGIESLGGIRAGLREVRRILEPGGGAVISVRSDNWENRLIDRAVERRNGKGDHFHKWCFTASEFRGFLEETGYSVDKVETVVNVPFLYKYAVFRAPGVSEGERRSGGYQLNLPGRILYKLLRLLFSERFGTTIVYTVRRPSTFPTATSVARPRL